MKLNKTFKKFIAVVCALAMVVTSITVNNITAKADGTWDFTLKEVVVYNNMYTVSVEFDAYTDDTIETANIYYSVYLDSTDEANRAISAANDGWDWNKTQQTWFNNVFTNHDLRTISLDPGSTHTIYVVAFEKNADDTYTALDQLSWEFTVPNEEITTEAPTEAPTASEGETETGVEQPSIDYESITDWTQLSGTSVDGATAYIDTAIVGTFGNEGLRGFYGANEGNAWGITASDALYSTPRFAFAHSATATTLVINGTRYPSDDYYAHYGTGDCVHISQSLLTAAEGETNYYIITAPGTGVGVDDTFVLKVVGKEPEKAPDQNIDVDAITDWALVGVSESNQTAADGSKYYVSASLFESILTSAAEIRGLYNNATTSPYVSANQTIGTAPVYSTVMPTVANTVTAAWIDGVKYESGSPEFYAEGDQVLLAQSLFTLPEGTDEKVFAITIVGSSEVTYALKVVKGEETTTPDETTTEEPVSGAPATPVGYVASVNDFGQGDVVYIAWAPTDNATGYKLYVDGAYVKDITSGVNLPVSEFTPGTHTFAISAYNADGESALTDAYTLTIPAVATTTYDVTVDGTVVATVDEGAEYTLPATAKYGYFDGTDMYKAGSTVTVTSDIAFTSVNELSVTVAQGAGIRVEEPAGIRFQAAVASDNMDAVASEAITEGMLITANDIYESLGNGTLDLTSTYTVKNIPNSGWYNDVVGTYCGSIVNIVESNYIRNFIARAYVTINYADGSEETVYSNMSSVRSIAQVAQNLIAAGALGTYTEAQQTLINAFAAAK